MGHRLNARCAAVCLTSVLLTASTTADEWNRFRGSNGSGVCEDAKTLPTEWSEEKNVAWRFQLPGPGLSSPIVVGECVFVTCWSGYAVDGQTAFEGDDQSKLLRWLVCIDKLTGKERWSRSVPPVLPEYPFRATVKDNGYATHTPTSDGQFVYAFFGKSGVFCFDLEGNQVWHADVGNLPDPRLWGSSASPVIYKDLVIVTASPESHAVIGLDKRTGKEVWRYESAGLADTHSTPVLAKVDESRTDLIVSVPGEIWGLDPDSGVRRWHCQTYTGYVSVACPLVEEGVIYLLGGDESRGLAIRGGGSGDVTETHVLWRGKAWTQLATPVLYKGYLWWVFQDTAYCADAKTGEQLSTLRLSEKVYGAEDPREARLGSSLSSPVVAANRMYYFARSGQAYVIELNYAIELGLEMVELAQNRIASDVTNHNATPAISDGALYFRSQRYLYCIAAEKQ